MGTARAISDDAFNHFPAAMRARVFRLVGVIKIAHLFPLLVPQNGHSRSLLTVLHFTQALSFRPSDSFAILQAPFIWAKSLGLRFFARASWGCCDMPLLLGPCPDAFRRGVVFLDGAPSMAELVHVHHADVAFLERHAHMLGQPFIGAVPGDAPERCGLQFAILAIHGRRIFPELVKQGVNHAPRFARVGIRRVFAWPSVCMGGHKPAALWPILTQVDVLRTAAPGRWLVS